MATQLCTVSDVLMRVRGEYMEMPGLSLTFAQAQRLWGLDPRTCECALGELVNAQFLRRSPDGLFVRFDSDTPRREFGT